MGAHLVLVDDDGERTEDEYVAENAQALDLSDADEVWWLAEQVERAVRRWRSA